MADRSIIAGLTGFLRDVVAAVAGGVRTPGVDAVQAERLAAHWASVEAHLMQGRWSQAVAEADKQLDAGLRIAGVKGSTMGERLKSAKGRFDQARYNQIWEAHKLRNRLAHELGASAAESQARQAVEVFRQALRTLGVPV